MNRKRDFYLEDYEEGPAESGTGCTGKRHGSIDIRTQAVGKLAAGIGRGRGRNKRRTQRRFTTRRPGKRTTRLTTSAYKAFGQVHLGRGGDASSTDNECQKDKVTLLPTDQSQGTQSIHKIPFAKEPVHFLCRRPGFVGIILGVVEMHLVQSVTKLSGKKNH